MSKNEWAPFKIDTGQDAVWIETNYYGTDLLLGVNETSMNLTAEQFEQLAEACKRAAEALRNEH